MTEPKKPWRDPPWVAPHIERYFSDPEGAHMWDTSAVGGQGLVPTLLLTTTGRKSGEPRHSPIIYQPTGDSFVAIASKGGYADHPAWYLNLAANREVEIRVGARHMRARARDAEGEERAALWAKLQAVYPFYDAYQARSPDRPFPVVVFDPIA